MSDGPGRAGLLTGTAAVACGLLAFALASVGTLTLVLGAAGVLALAAALVDRSRRLATAGGAALYCQLLAAVLAGLGPALALAAAVATLLAWTFAHSGSDFAATLGDAPAGALEPVHVLGTAAVAAVAALAAYAAFGVSLGGLPPSMALAFLLAAVGLTAALRP